MTREILYLLFQVRSKTEEMWLITVCAADCEQNHQGNSELPELPA